MWFAQSAGHTLICRIGTRLCALPLTHVVETLRPLRATPLAGAPEYVLGVALIRGIGQPVVDVARLLGEDDAEITRYVTLRIGERRVALAVRQVVGTRVLDLDELQDLPPLLRHVGQDSVRALGQIDAELLLVLDSARLIPQDEVMLAAAAAEGLPA